jgi:hypothetical protein
VAGSPADDPAILGQIPDPALPPDLLLLAFDACQRLLSLLEGDNQRQVALWKLAGHTNEAIATKLGRSPATVERTLARIRETWRRHWVDAVPRGPAKSGPRPQTTASVGQSEPEPQGIGDIDQDDTSQILRDLAGLP